MEWNVGILYKSMSVVTKVLKLAYYLSIFEFHHYKKAEEMHIKSTSITKSRCTSQLVLSMHLFFLTS